jgi:hypothetical protein
VAAGRQNRLLYNRLWGPARAGSRLTVKAGFNGWQHIVEQPMRCGGKLQDAECRMYYPSAAAGSAVWRATGNLSHAPASAYMATASEQAELQTAAGTFDAAYTIVIQRHHTRLTLE